MVDVLAQTGPNRTFLVVLRQILVYQGALKLFVESQGSLGVVGIGVLSPGLEKMESPEADIRVFHGDFKYKFLKHLTAIHVLLGDCQVA